MIIVTEKNNSLLFSYQLKGLIAMQIPEEKITGPAKVCEMEDNAYAWTKPKTWSVEISGQQRNQ